MLVWIVAPLVVLVCVGVGVRFGVPACRGWQYGRCLERIDQLELELGFRGYGLDERIAVAVRDWHAAAIAKQANYTGPRTLVYCTACGREVVRELGGCRPRLAGCAKVELT